jgi:predicted Zn finger-like uncharacterized protein
MSLNTRCPACETIFKVVPDQLKISSGWVRCGRCAEVFDAATHMLAPTGKPAGAAARPEPRKVTDTVPQPSQPLAPPMAVPTTPVPSPETPFTPLVAPPLVPATPTAAPLASAMAEPVPVPAVDLSQVPELSFVRHAKKKAFWQQSQIVRGLLALLLVLATVLVLQVAVDQRNQIAAKYPDLQVGLEALCSPLGCRIEPVKQLDVLKIESSTFQKIQESALGDTFTLKVTLKNNATLPLAVPALELSLTDTNDKAIVRRVLLAQELGFQGKTLAASGEWNGAASIFVGSSSGQNQPAATVTGYRVLAFYP